MLSKRGWLLLASAGLVLTLASCSSEVVPTKRKAPKDYPFTPPAYTGLPAKRPTTKVLTDFAQKTIKDFSIDGKLTIDTRAVPHSASRVNWGR